MKCLTMASGLLALCLALPLGAAELPSPTPAPEAAPVAELFAEAGACAAPAVTVGQPDWLPMVCASVRCLSNAECETACPTALTAVCSQRACVYTYSGGGGGGGGGTGCNPSCTQSFQCQCNGQRGYCWQGTCEY